MKRLSQSKNHTQLWIGLVMEARSDAEKAILQHVCSWNVRSWNVRSMNWGKLELVKQVMARVNTDILGISKLKWIGMGEFNWDDHYIYYCGQESLRRYGVAIIVNKRVQNAVLGCALKTTEWSLRFQGKPFISRKSKYMPWPVMLKKLMLNGSMKTYKTLELTPKKDVPFIIGDWNAKVGSQETPGITGKFGLGALPGSSPCWIQGFPQEDSVGERIAKQRDHRLDLTGLCRKPIKFVTPYLLWPRRPQAPSRIAEGAPP